ncbi:hypothetical protein Pla108_14350 [Botrimarina colliarenosi]|uniref:Uncharacterized protein n=1 Tax=Botrimarina colliarenosi TaxID=2528001 RepID=A0A5C6AQL2_9BACT|nr:hypothetical protein [Botrimarina colliarenosi]TWU00484.1 hypothetical protein Pla108_14350 [Botrimarina colliarenosi]
MSIEDYNANGRRHPNGETNNRAFGKGSPNDTDPATGGRNFSTPFVLGSEVFDAYAADPDGVTRIGHHVGLQWDSNPDHRERLADAESQRADNERQKQEHLHDVAVVTAAKRRARLERRRVVGEPKFRTPDGRLKFDAKKAIVLAVAVAVLLLGEFLGATSLALISGWTFIDESWWRAGLLTFPVVVSGYVQLRNFLMLLRGRPRRRFRLGVFAVGLVIAVMGLFLFSLSLGDAHRETDGMAPPEPLVPYALLTCLSMGGAAVSLLAVESWLQEKIDACRQKVCETDPTYIRLDAKVKQAMKRVAEHESRQIDAESTLKQLQCDRAAWVDWAQSQVRLRQIERSTQQQRDAEQRRLVAAKRQADLELSAFKN